MINLPNQTSKRVADTKDEALGSQNFSHRRDERYIVKTYNKGSWIENHSNSHTHNQVIVDDSNLYSNKTMLQIYL